MIVSTSPDPRSGDAPRGRAQSVRRKHGVISSKMSRRHSARLDQPRKVPRDCQRTTAIASSKEPAVIANEGH